MSAIFRKTKRQILFGVIFFLFLPFSYNCIEKPNEFMLPKWDTELTIPLIHRTYHFGDLIAKDSAFIVVNDTLVYYQPASLKDDPRPITIPPLDPQPSTFVGKLGLIPINAVKIDSVDMSFQNLTGQVPAGIPWPGPEISSNQSKELLGDTATYDYIIYEEGQMSLTIRNTFPFDVTFAPGGIDLVDTTGTFDVIIGNFNIGTVAKNGGTSTAVISLNGLKLSSALRMRFVFQTVDLTGKTVTTAQKISASISVTRNGVGNPSLSEAKMRLLTEYYMPIADVRDSVQTFDDSTYLKSADFESGNFRVRIDNRIPFDIVVKFKIRELREIATDSPFRLRDNSTQLSQDSVVIGARDLYDENYDLTNYRMEARKADPSAPNPNDTLTNGFHFSMDIKTLVHSTVKTVVRKSDSVIVEVLPEESGNVILPYYISEAVGKIAPNYFDINESIEGGIGESTSKFTADSLIFDGARIVLKIYSTSLFPTDLRFSINGVKNGVIGQALPQPSNRPDGSYRMLVRDTIKIVYSGDTLDNFLSSFAQGGKFAFPDSFTVTGSALIEPPDLYQSDYIGTIRNNDSLHTSLDFLFPLRIGIMNGSYKDTASISANIADTAQLGLIKEGQILFDLYSTFPAGIEVRSKLLQPDPSDSSKPDLFAPPVLVLDTIRIDGSPDHSLDSSFSFITLSGDDASKLNKAAFNALDIRLVTALNNGSSPVNFYQSDSIIIHSSATVKFTVDKDKLSNNK